MVDRGWGRASGELLFDEDRVSVWEDESIVEIEPSGSDSYTT